MPAVSRKTALCASDVTKRRILGGRRDGKAHSACAPHQETYSACEQSRRMRLSVRTQSQNAPFRRMRLSSPGQTRRRLTKNRILRPPPHEKPHSGPSGLIHHRMVMGDAGTPDGSSTHKEDHNRLAQSKLYEPIRKSLDVVVPLLDFDSFTEIIKNDKKQI